MAKYVTIYVNDWQGRGSIEENINLSEVSHFNKETLTMRGGKQFEINDGAYKALKEAIHPFGTPPHDMSNGSYANTSSSPEPGE